MYKNVATFAYVLNLSHARYLTVLGLRNEYYERVPAPNSGVYLKVTINTVTSYYMLHKFLNYHMM